METKTNCDVNIKNFNWRWNLRLNKFLKIKISITVYRRSNFNPKFNQFLNREDQVAGMGRHQNHKLFRSSTWLRIGELCELSVRSVRGSEFAAFQKVFGVCVTGKVSGFQRPPPTPKMVMVAPSPAASADDDETRLSEGKTFLFVLPWVGEENFSRIPSAPLQPWRVTVQGQEVRMGWNKF